MKILLDMNLTPAWCDVLEQHGHEAVHWSDVGDPRAEDRLIMQWAATHGYVVFTHDLDFGTLLAVTQSDKPSVIQVRTENVMPAHLAGMILTVLEQHRAPLESGALVVVEEWRSRIRVLPLRR